MQCRSGGEGGVILFCVECKVPQELLLHTDQLMPPLELEKIGFERFEENELDHATMQEEQQ